MTIAQKLDSPLAGAICVVICAAVVAAIVFVEIPTVGHEASEQTVAEIQSGYGVHLTQDQAIALNSGGPATIIFDGHLTQVTLASSNGSERRLSIVVPHTR